ncbi:MAG: DUF4433 domain-containing protein [candidate division Zixibacteria bacterium]
MTTDKTLICRITHYKNLEGILKRGGIYASNFQPNDGIKFYPIHHVDIQNQRSVINVPCGPGGSIHDYVPYYFGPRSPMLFAISKNKVEEYNEGQQPVIYICAYAEDIKDKGLDFVFTDGHAIMAITRFFDDLKDLDKLYWDIIEGKYWFDSEQYPDRCRRRQAEFLVHKFFPLDCVFEIVVIDKHIQKKVNSVLAKHDIDIPVVVKKNWYY